MQLDKKIERTLYRRAMNIPLLSSLDLSLILFARAIYPTMDQLAETVNDVFEHPE